MTEKANNERFRFLTSSWVITLTATLIGVFVALYLNEKVSLKKIENQKIIATKNILAEISSNKEKLNTTLNEHKKLLDIIQFMSKYFDAEKESLIVKSDEMNQFQLDYPNVLSITDSTLINKELYDYSGELEIKFSVPQIEITTIAWRTLNNSGVSSTYDFECLMYLESIYKATEETLIKNSELLEYFATSKVFSEKNGNTINRINILIDLEESLIQIYELSEEELKNCG